MLTFVGPLPYPSLRPRFSLVLLRVFFLPAHAHVLHLLMDARLCRWEEALFQDYCSCLIANAPKCPSWYFDLLLRLYAKPLR